MATSIIIAMVLDDETFSLLTFSCLFVFSLFGNSQAWALESNNQLEHTLSRSIENFIQKEVEEIGYLIGIIPEICDSNHRLIRNNKKVIGDLNAKYKKQKEAIKIALETIPNLNQTRLKFFKALKGIEISSSSNAKEGAAKISMMLISRKNRVL